METMGMRETDQVLDEVMMARLAFLNDHPGHPPLKLEIDHQRFYALQKSDRPLWQVTPLPGEDRIADMRVVKVHEEDCVRVSVDEH